MERTLPGRIQRLLVEGVETLHLTDELETVETGGLLDIGGDGAGFGTGGEEVVFSLDFCNGQVSRDSEVIEWMDGWM